MYKSVKAKFCSGSSNSKSTPITSDSAPPAVESISSSKITGFLKLARLSPLTINPGSAWGKVLGCPLSCRALDIPPIGILRRALPKLSAIELAKEVFPEPGKPTKHKTKEREGEFSLFD